MALDAIGRTQEEREEEYRIVGDIEAAMKSGTSAPSRQRSSGRRSDDLFNSGPASGDVPTRNPIGVPAGFQTQVPAPVPYARDATVPAGPRYFEGDEWTPASWRANEVADLQRAMVGVGLIPEGKRYRNGVYDDTTRSGFRKLLGFSNGTGMTYDKALQRYALGTTEEAGGGEPLPKPTIRLSNKADLRAVIRNSAREALGSGNVDEDVVQRIISAFHAQEQRYQTQTFNAQQTGAGGTVMEPPSVETFVDTELKRSDPVAYDARKVINALSILMEMMAGDAA